MKIEKLKVYDVISYAAHLCIFDVDIDKRPTRCVIDYNKDTITVKLRVPRGDIVLSLDDYINAKDMDMIDFLKHKLEDVLGGQKENSDV